MGWNYNKYVILGNQFLSLEADSFLWSTVVIFFFHATKCTVHCINRCYSTYVQVFCVVFCPCTLLVGRGRMRSHPSPANSHQSGPMLEPQREEAIAHSTGVHSPSTQGGQGHLTHQGPVYFSLLCMCVSAVVYVSVIAWACACVYVNACTVISTMFQPLLFVLVGSSLHQACR